MITAGPHGRFLARMRAARAGHRSRQTRAFPFVKKP
jgi:hypothetical protein